MARWLLTRQRMIVAAGLAARGDTQALWQRARLLRRASGDELPELREGCEVAGAPTDGSAPTVMLMIPFAIGGGAERMLSGVAARLVSAGHRVIVLTTRSAPYGYGDRRTWFSDAGSRFCALPELVPQRGWLAYVDELLLSEQVDVLWLAGSDYVYRELAQLRRRHPQLCVIDSLFNAEVHLRRHLELRDQIDLTIVESEAVRSRLLDLGEDPAKLVRIPNGVDTALFKEPDSSPRLTLTNVGFVGRLAAEKDPVAFVDLAASCRALPLRFHIAGDGPLSGVVARRARRRGLRDMFVLHGFLPDVRVLLSQLDALVLPSRVDGRPNAVLEALAMSVPVLASPVGALPELIDDGVDGFLCATAGEFADRIRWLHANPAHWLQMRGASREAAVREFDVATSLERYEQVISQLVADRRVMSAHA